MFHINISVGLECYALLLEQSALVGKAGCEPSLRGDDAVARVLPVQLRAAEYLPDEAGISRSADELRNLPVACHSPLRYLADNGQHLIRQLIIKHALHGHLSPFELRIPHRSDALQQQKRRNYTDNGSGGAYNAVYFLRLSVMLLHIVLLFIVGELSGRIPICPSGYAITVTHDGYSVVRKKLNSICYSYLDAD